jgi:hypothetical protein
VHPSAALSRWGAASIRTCRRPRQTVENLFDVRANHKKSVTVRVTRASHGGPTRHDALFLPSSIELESRHASALAQWDVPDAAANHNGKPCYRFLKWLPGGVALRDASTEISDERRTVSPGRGCTVSIGGLDSTPVSTWGNR